MTSRTIGNIPLLISRAKTSLKVFKSGVGIKLTAVTIERLGITGGFD